MSRTTTTDRTLTELDHVRLSRLLQRHRQGGAAPAALAALQDLLDDATLVPSAQVPPDVVTMYARVEVQDPATARRSTLTVCYPPDAAPEQGRVSALSPLGAGLLGRRVGELARWAAPDGAPRALQIAALAYQPEASGDYTR